MRKYFDFIIDDNSLCKKVLRFYPCQSHIHGFDDESPNNWNKVYKTYMTFSVLLYWKDDSNNCEKMFSYNQEEGEGLRILRETLQDIISGSFKKLYEIYPLGYGTNWLIKKNQNNAYEFYMTNRITGNAYYFVLDKKEIKSFHKVLDNFLGYMLKHSEGI